VTAIAQAFVRVRPEPGTKALFQRETGSAATAAGEHSGRLFGGTFAKTSAGPLRSVVGLRGPLIAGFAALGGIKVFSSFIGQARESAKIGAITTQVIKSTGGAANLTAAQVGKLATAISNKTGVDDEAIQSGENLLLTFTNVRNEVGRGNDIFSQATSTITDMSVALGQDTKSSAIQLGKALNDPIKGVTALQRVGVSFTKSQKDQIATLVKSGDTLGAQKLILHELGREFGGTAAAASTSTDKLKVSLGNIAESIGGVFIPLIDKAAGGINDFISGFTVGTDEIGSAQSKWAQFGTIAYEAFTKVKDGISLVIDAGSKIIDLIGPVGQVKDAFEGAFTNRFRVYETGFLGFVQSAGIAAGNAKDTIATVFAAVGPAISDAVKRTVVDFKPLAARLVANAAGLAGNIIKGLQSGLETGNLAPLGAALGNALVQAIKGAGVVSGKIGAAVIDMIKGVDWVGAGLKAGAALLPFVIGLVAGISNALFSPATWSQIKDHWLDVLVGVISIIPLGRILGPLAKVFEHIPILRMFAPLLRGVETAGRFLERAFSATIGRALRAFASGFLAGFRRVFPEVGKRFAAELEVLPTRIGVLGLRLLSAGRSLVTSLGRGILSGARFIGSVIGRVIGWLIRPFAGAAGWLLGHGARVVGGLVRGVLRAGGAVAGAAARIIRTLLGPFAGAASWLVRAGVDATVGLARGLARGFSAVARYAGGIGGRILSAIGDLGSILFNAGANVIQGLIDGIRSKIGALTSTIGGIAGKIKDFFPHSPAKTGPLAGTGGMDYAGRNIISQLAQGIHSQRSLLAGTVGRVVGSGIGVPSMRLPGVHHGAGGGSATIELHNYTVLDGEILDHRIERYDTAQARALTYGRR
jgi:hypothetical protein